MKKIFLIIVASAVIIASFYLLLNNTYLSRGTNLNDLDEMGKPINQAKFHSELMESEMIIPSNFNIEDKLSSVTISDDRGEISLVRIGTEFETIADHLAYSNEMNNLLVLESRKSVIDAHNSIIQMSETSDGKRYYSHSVKIGDYVYGFSTDSPDLYDDLDQIAKSFRFIGD